MERAASLLAEDESAVRVESAAPRWKTAGGIPVSVRALPPLDGAAGHDSAGLRLHLELARLGLLRGFDQLLCLEGLTGVEHLPHQIETVRKVLRHFRGRVLLADEVGLGKTIEACLLLREYLLRGLARRVLILSAHAAGFPVAGRIALEVPPRVRRTAGTRQADKAEYWAGRSRAGFDLLRQEPAAGGGGGCRAVGPGDCRRGPSLQEPRHAKLAARRLLDPPASVPPHRHARAKQPPGALQPADAAGAGPPENRIGFQAAVRSPRQSPRPAQPRAAPRAAGRSHGPQYAKPGEHRSSAALCATMMAQPQGEEEALYRRLNQYLRRRKALPGAAEDEDADGSDPADSAHAGWASDSAAIAPDGLEVHPTKVPPTRRSTFRPWAANS